MKFVISLTVYNKQKKLTLDLPRLPYAQLYKVFRLDCVHAMCKAELIIVINI